MSTSTNVQSASPSFEVLTYTFYKSSYKVIFYINKQAVQQENIISIHRPIKDILHIFLNLIYQYVQLYLPIQLQCSCNRQTRRLSLKDPWLGNICWRDPNYLPILPKLYHFRACRCFTSYGLQYWKPVFVFCIFLNRYYPP